MNLKTVDVRQLVALGASLAGVSMLGVWLHAWWLVALASSGGVVVLAAIVIDAKRSVLRGQEQQRTQVQALIALHQLLPVRAPLPPMDGWACTPELAALVVGQILQRRPRVVLELGSGVSTIVSAYALERNRTGRVVSLDHDPIYAARTRAELEAHGHGSRAQVVDASLVDQLVEGKRYRWYDLSRLELEAPIDILVIDGPTRATGPQARYPALPNLAHQLAPDAIVILDDAGRPDEQAALRRWMKRFGAEFDLTFLPSIKGIAILRRAGRKRVDDA